MRAYYGSRLSENMTVTPEGYLICLNVPIARTGTQVYLNYELGLDENPNEAVDVHREESEVFSSATMASFEGKPVTDDHPPVTVTPENNAAYNCGHAQNIRRGSGEESDLLIADLFITSPRLIEEIRNGLREVSCGYDCEYVQDEDGRIYQRCIRGNHVAVVSAGRAGARVAIKDSAESKTNHEERGTYMNKTKSNSLLAKLFGHAVKDMEPEEVAAAIDELQNATAAPVDEAPEPAPAQTAEKPKDSDPMIQLLAAVNGLASKIDQLLVHKDAEPEKEEASPANKDPLEKLADEIAQSPAETPADQEASATVPAESIHDEESQSCEGTTDEEGPEAPAETLPENPIPGADKAAALYAISAIKPIIAKLPPTQRKAASDRAAAEIRRMLGMNAKAASNGYTGIMNAMRQNVGSKAKDAKPKADNGDLGRRIMESRNPHYMRTKS